MGALLGGIFTATVNGDVLIDHEKFDGRRADRGGSTWKSFRGELRKMASKGNSEPAERTPEHLEREIKDAFKLFDVDNRGCFNTTELGMMMKKLGEHLTGEELRELEERADADGSGEIDYEEFKTVLLKT